MARGRSLDQACVVLRRTILNKTSWNDQPRAIRLFNYRTALASCEVMGSNDLIPRPVLSRWTLYCQAGPLWSLLMSGDVGLDENQGGLGSFKKTVLPAFRSCLEESRIRTVPDASL